MNTTSPNRPTLAGVRKPSCLPPARKRAGCRHTHSTERAPFVRWVCLAGVISPSHEHNFAKPPDSGGRPQAVVFATRSQTGGLSPHPFYGTRAIRKLGVFGGCDFLQHTNTTPPNRPTLASVPKPSFLPPSRKRASCRHTHSTSSLPALDTRERRTNRRRR